VLGKLLKIPDEDEKFTEFPSPEVLKGRILISTKPPSEFKKGKHGKAGEAVAQATTKVENAAEKVVLKKQKPKAKPLGKEDFDWGDEVPSFEGSVENENASMSAEDELEEEDLGQDGQGDHVSNLEYKKIISIRAGKPKGGSLVDALVVDEVVKRVSLSEPQLEKVAEKHPSKLIE
jgi:phosphatidylinositol phospholipase C delta